MELGTIIVAYLWQEPLLEGVAEGTALEGIQRMAIGCQPVVIKHADQFLSSAHSKAELIRTCSQDDQ